MKACRLTVVVFGVAMFCVSAMAQIPIYDECFGRVLIGRPVPPFDCNGSGTADNCLATTGADDLPMPCTNGVDFGSIYFSFVASHTSARVRTDLNSIARASAYTVYEVDQNTPCDKSLWGQVGCSEDDSCTSRFLGDICVTGLTVGHEYVIQLVSWDAASCGSYTVDVRCPCPPPCGDGCCDAAAGEDWNTCPPDCPCPPCTTRNPLTLT